MKEPISKLCINRAEKLAAAHPDDLPSDERGELDAHVAKCPACAAARAEYHLMDVLIRAYPSRGTLPGLFPPRLVLPESRDECDRSDDMPDEIVLSPY